MSGTSASSPALAGLLTLINEGRLRNGDKPLGFVNPLLYRAYAFDPSIFNDVSGPVNNGCTHIYCTLECGFPPVKDSWDAVTGLGSINFGRLYEYATQ